jgi:HK97 family phage major capsid protein
MSKTNYAALVNDAVKKMQSLLDTAKGESRSLTDEELTVFNELESSVTKWEADAEREKKLQSVQDRISKAVNADIPVTNTVDVRVGVNRETKKPWNNHGEFFTAVKNASNPANTIIDARLLNGANPSAPVNATGLQISVGSDGGFMVGSDTESWLMQSVEANSVIFPRISKIPVGENKNSISLPALDETSRANGSRFGGVNAYWSAEASTAAASKPRLREVDIKLEKLLAFVYSTEELLQDSRALETFLYKAFGAEFGFVLDDSIINGDGNGKPLGINNCPAAITVSKEGSQAADTIVYENVVKMWSRLAARNRANAVWMITPEAETQLYSMSMTIGSGGVPVYMPPTGLSQGQYSTLFGKPVLVCEQLPKLGDKGDLILADLNDYIGIDKGGLQTDTSIHVQFLYDENVFRFRYRFNGLPYTKSAIASKSNSSFTTSPYVNLQAR